jgi:hypothetical protein
MQASKDSQSGHSDPDRHANHIFHSVNEWPLTLSRQIKRIVSDNHKQIFYWMTNNGIFSLLTRREKREESMLGQKDSIRD